jgi:SAM-dependent methyltransferase
LPRRTISILGSLNLTLRDRFPAIVLDVGSGTGATDLALELLDAPRHIFLSGLEQSAEMIAFAHGVPARRRVSAHFVQGSLLDVMDSTLEQKRFELVVLSAALPYEFNQCPTHSDATNRMRAR